MGWTLKSSAIAVGISYDYAKEILKKSNELSEEGVKNIKNKHRESRGGKKSIFNEKQLEKLAQELKLRPADGGIWTGTKVARWSEKENGIEKVGNLIGWDYLKKLKYSCQRPRPKHRKGNPLEQAEFIRTLPLKIKTVQQQAPEAEIDVWFFDEHRVGLKPILRKVWSKTGERPTAIVSHRYQWLYVYGFVKPKTGETLWYLIPRVNTLWLNLVYNNFAINAGISHKKKAFLVEDNAGWHRSKKVETHAGIIVDYLPAYSPELQPAERLWTLVDEPLVNEYFETIDEMEEVLIKRCNVLSEMKEEIRNITNYHWLNFL